MSAPVDLEYKNIASPDAVPGDATGALNEGVIEALVAVTGVKDDVGDVIVPGAFSNTLRTRKPKVCLGHDWNRPIGKTLQIKELMPGDPNLPKTTAEGKPWPREAGAVWAQFQTNMDIDDGKNAFHSAKFYGPESTYSIGYKATTAKHKAGTRYIHELDLFEFGPVLHPANRLATLQSIKAAELEGIEYTDAEPDDEKGVMVEELTLRDYAAILDIMEEKAATIRRVSDAEYWGLPVGTIIKPGMKPKGKARATTRGTTVEKPSAAPRHQEVPAGAKPKGDDGPTEKPSASTEDLAKIQAVGEELGMEVRPNPWPPVYIVKPPKGTLGSGGRVINFQSDSGKASTDNGMKIPAGRVEEYMRAWEQLREKGKDGYAPRAENVLAEMDRPAKEAAAKVEADRKKQEAVANATDDELAGQAQFEVDRLVRLDQRQAEMQAAGRSMDEASAERARAHGRANLEIVNAELVKRGLPAYDLPGPNLSTKPTGGRPVQEILDSIPDNREGKAARHGISNGADVLDGPSGSGVFAVGPMPDADKNSARSQWTITLGNGLSIPASAIVRSVSNERAIDVSTPKKVTAWLKAMGELRDADGNPPPYGTGTAPELLAWRDAEGRSLKDALTEVVAPAYLKAIGKSGARSGDGGDKTKAANWRNNPALAATKLPPVMFSQFTDLGQNGKQAYILGRTEGDDHATALKRAKDMVADARSARESAEAARDALPTGPSYAPVNRAIVADDNGEVPTPEGEISTTRLLSLDRVTGPAAIAAMEIPELERHDAELTRRATGLGKPGVTSPAHQAVKNALLRKTLDARQEAADRARADRIAAETPDQRRVRMITEAPSKVADARRLGRMTRGEIALREVNKELPLNNISGNAHNVLRGTGGLDGAREDGVISAELARGIASDAEFMERADTADRVADIIDSWGVDLGAESDLPAKLRAWAEGVRSVLNAPPEQRGDPGVEKVRQRLAEQTDDPDRARRSGIPTRGPLAFTLAAERLGMANPISYARVIFDRDSTADDVREQARVSAEDGNLNAWQLEQLDQAVTEIDSWNVDFGRDRDIIDRARAWVAGSREGLEQRVAPEVITSVAMEDGRVLTPVDTRSGEKRAFGLTSGDYTLRVYELNRPNKVGAPWAYDIVNNTTGGVTRGAGTYSTPGSALVRAESEFQAAERRTQAPGLNLAEREEERRYQAAVDRAAAAEATVPNQATARANAQARREAVRRGETVARPALEVAPESEVGAGSWLTAEDRAEMDRLKSEGRDNEAAKYYADARARARADGGENAEQTATIAPELLDEAAESEAASVGLSETPDGALEVEPEVAERQDRVEKLIKDADDGKLNLAEQSTEDLTSTRRDLVDELRLQTAIRRRAPRAARPATDTPKVRPGLAGAAEDHAEALRSGDAAAIERTQARLRSSIRRSRVDSEIARSLADSITSPDDNDADQLSDLAKRLRAESRERRNATTRKRRTAKRIERERLQSLLGAVDTELRGRGVRLDEVRPELLAPDEDGTSRPKLTAKQKTVMLTADQEGWIVGHGVTVNSLITNNLASWPRGTTVPLNVQKRGSSWAQLNENGLAELALLRNS